MEGAPFSGPRRAALSVGAIINAAFELYRRQARGAWATVTLIVVPAQVIVWLLIKVSLSSNAYARSGTVYTSSTAVPTVAIALLGFLSAVLTVGALSRLLVEEYSGQRTTWQDSLGYASTHLVPLVALAIVSGVLLTIGYLLFVIPGVFFTVAWCAAFTVLMYERTGPLRSLSRSWELVKGHWWMTFGALLVGLVIVFGISFLVGLILGGAASSSSVDVVLILSGISRAVAAILAYPLVAAIAVVLYVNLRSEKEGLPKLDTTPPQGPITRY
jgi:hypothetical protein